MAQVASDGERADPNAGIESQVRAAFPDAPDMIAVAKCESGYRQFAAPGTVLHGGTGGAYVGIFQIGERLHRAAALAKGDDIDTIVGNIAYARVLYDASGSVPWRECVPKAATIAAAPTDTAKPSIAETPAKAPALAADLRIGMTHPEVRMVQRLLNAAGFVVAANGGGSPGNETDRFGALTRDAVRRFQCAKKIACDGNERTTGYGRVGPLTRALLMRAR
ncbi:MAG: putative peptidoglycan binding domain [Candidatus Parcubacteria bacterium]|jgi:hypothetical protein